MVALAAGPEDDGGTAGERASDTPDTPSAFEEGQTPLAGFFLAAHEPESLFVADAPLSC